MANTFKFGNKNWAVKKDSVLAYNDENNNFKPLPFDFTRDSTATYVDSDGLIKTAGQGEARIDYLDNADGHLLLEPARTNLITYSEDFSNAAWVKSNTTFSSNIVTANSGSSLKYILQNETTQGVQTAFFDVEYIDHQWLHIFVGTSAGDTGFVNFDIQNKVVGYESGGFTGNVIDYGSFIRILVNINTTGKTNIILTFIDSNELTRAPASSSTGSFKLYRSQLEAASYATSYIPTEGSSVTRVAETCTGAGNSEVFNDSEGVLFAEISALANDLTYRSISINGYISLFYNNVSNTIVGYSTGGALIIKQLSDITSFNKIAFKYKANDFALWVNGVELGTDTSGTTSNSLTTLNYDNGAGGSKWYGSTKQIQYFDTALTDAELAALTT